ncbi:MAG: NBR1-Ig-like domain-containing protein [Anaerolineales bacterium]|nr:NBR1-Ig-like domain-containing protein [Anaerolineales bacterium]MDW8161531.1 NBR1-Ig-like domain-containing protein [Anaerolineales bacterium]
MRPSWHNLRTGCLILGILVLFLSGCNLPGLQSQALPDERIAPTRTAEAVQSLLMTQMAGTLAPPTATPTPPSPTAPSQATITPTATVATPRSDLCLDKAGFVEDITIPDNTVLKPGERFTKTWRLQNRGDCAWSPQYALVFVEGDRMDAPLEIPLAGYVKPNETVDLSVEMTAPAESGQYQGQWMLRSADGSRFGIGEKADKPFWVRIVVSDTVSDLNLGTPTWRDTFKNASNWYLLKTAYTEFRVKDGALVMEATPGGSDEWGLATHTAIQDFYMEVEFRTGEKCSGKDRYGLLFRAPSPNAGYVFGFSCEGRYRLYRWDGRNYNPLQEWTPSPAILSGPGQTNRLGVWAEGATLKLYANEVLLTELSDSTYLKGRFGLFIAAVESDPFKVFVEEIAYWLLK